MLQLQKYHYIIIDMIVIFLQKLEDIFMKQIDSSILLLACVRTVLLDGSLPATVKYAWFKNIRIRCSIEISELLQNNLKIILDFGEAKEANLLFELNLFQHCMNISEFKFARAFCYFLASQKVSINRIIYWSVLSALVQKILC